jgi:hypothetical protein
MRESSRARVKPEVGWWRRFFACCSERDAIALAVALPRCRLLTCDAFIADVVRRSGLDTRFRCELFTGAARGHRQAWLPLESL